jgi:hypothetical protein
MDLERPVVIRARSARVWGIGSSRVRHVAHHRDEAAQNHREVAQNGGELAHFGAMLQKFSFEWRRFSPQVHRRQEPAISAGVRGIDLQCWQGLTAQFRGRPRPPFPEHLAGKQLRSSPAQFT